MLRTVAMPPDAQAAADALRAALARLNSATPKGVCRKESMKIMQFVPVYVTRRRHQRACPQSRSGVAGGFRTFVLDYMKEHQQVT